MLTLAKRSTGGASAGPKSGPEESGTELGFLDMSAEIGDVQERTAGAFRFYSHDTDLSPVRHPLFPTRSEDRAGGARREMQDVRQHLEGLPGARAGGRERSRP